MVIYCGGSRSLSSSPLVAPFVAAALSASHSFSVGCASGADALVIQSVIAQGGAARLSVFAAFGQGGAGACGVSNVAGVAQAARAGASVRYLAGGALSLPLAARLMRRSLAGLSGASVAVFFSPASGSLAVAGRAVAQGVPVFAFGACPSASPRGCVGAWVASSFLGLSCWSWQVAQQSLF